MSKSIVAVTDANDSTMVDYVQKQLDAIAILFPELAIEHVNKDNPIMARYERYPGRLPAFFILKNGARMGSLQAKVSNEQLINWVSSTCG